MGRASMTQYNVNHSNPQRNSSKKTSQRNLKTKLNDVLKSYTTNRGVRHFFHHSIKFFHLWQLKHKNFLQCVLSDTATHRNLNDYME